MKKYLFLFLLPLLFAFPKDVFAEVLNLKPVSIDIVSNGSSTITSTVRNGGSWGGVPVYTWNENIPTDWQGGASLRYNYSGTSYYCTHTNNIATIKGSFLSGYDSSVTNVSRYSSGSGLVSCDYNINGGRVDFTCYNVDTSNGYFLALNNAPSGTYGISQDLTILCEYDNEMAVNDIINNNNQNTQNIINNNNQNTQDIIDSNKDTQDKIDQTNDKLVDINDNLTNGDVRDFSIGDFDLGIDLDPENSPITALLTLPVSLLNAFLSGLEGKCFGYDIPFFFGNEITLPCINMESYLGKDLWHTIDLICCIFLIYNIGLMVVSFYERVTSLHDVFDGLYSPKHQAPDGYVPKHGRD